MVPVVFDRGVGPRRPFRSAAERWAVAWLGFHGRRRRPRIYGEHRIDLEEHTGQRRGWASGAFELDARKAVKRYKTFVATWQPAGGTIRVVLVDEPTSGPPTSAPALPRRRPTSSGAWPTAPAWRTPNQTTPEGGGGSARGGSFITGGTALPDRAAWCGRRLDAPPGGPACPTPPAAPLPPAPDDAEPAPGVGAPPGRPAEATPRPARPAPRPAPRGPRPRGGRP